MKLYFGSYRENVEVELSQQIVLEDDKGISICTTLGGLIQMLSEKDREIMSLTDALEETGKRVCPLCGEIYDEDDMSWSEYENAYVCKDCKEEEER